MSIHKHIGRAIEMIYEDRRGRLTYRHIRVLAADNGKIRAYDLDKRALRVFDAGRILAMRPVKRHVS